MPLLNEKLLEQSDFVQDIYTGSGNGNPMHYFKAGNVLYLMANDADHGTELWRLGQPTVGIESDLYGTTFSLIPNPVQQTIKVISNDEILLLSVTNIEGKILRTISNCNEMDIPELASGTYILAITNKAGVKKMKFVKL